MSYAYLTRKQANTMYSAHKRGEITLNKSIISTMYHIVGVPTNELNDSETEAYLRIRKGLDLYFKSSAKDAETYLNGGTIREIPSHISFQPWRIATADEKETLKETGKLIKVNPITGEVAPERWPYGWRMVVEYRTVVVPA